MECFGFARRPAASVAVVADVADAIGTCPAAAVLIVLAGLEVVAADVVVSVAVVVSVVLLVVSVVSLLPPDGVLLVVVPAADVDEAVDAG